MGSHRRRCRAFPFDRRHRGQRAQVSGLGTQPTPSPAALAAMGRFSDPAGTAYLGTVLEGHLERILERYLTRLSPLADVRVSGDELCATDLAEWRHLRPSETFAYEARVAEGSALRVRREPGARVCVTVPHGRPYMRVVVRDGVARGARGDGWDGRNVRATGRASRHPGRERGPCCVKPVANPVGESRS